MFKICLIKLGISRIPKIRLYRNTRADIYGTEIEGRSFKCPDGPLSIKGPPVAKGPPPEEFPDCRKCV